MTEQHRPQPARVPFLDAHVHHWDPAKPDWYPYLAPDGDLPHLGLGDITGMKRRFDQEAFLSEARPWQIEGYVHVSAAIAPGMHLPETEALAALAQQTGSPGAIIGAIDPTKRLPEIAAELDRQLASPHFCGVRIMAGLDYRTTRAAQILGMIAERGLIYDLHVGPNAMLAAARALERVESLSVVVEHCGCPTHPDSPAERIAWQQGITALAERPHTAMKFSGLPMVLHQISAAAFSPWFEPIVTAFGTERVLIGSNFPVDGLYGTLPELLDTYLELARPLGPDAAADLFSATARRIYLQKRSLS